MPAKPAAKAKPAKPAAPAVDMAAVQGPELEGRSVRRPFPDAATGKQKFYKGKVDFLGQKAAPYCFKITYRDGDTETMTREEIEKVLVPL